MDLRYKRLLPVMIQRFGRAIRPVLKKDDGSGKLRVVATATTVAVLSRRYLVTAEHTFDEPGARFVTSDAQRLQQWPAKRFKLESIDPLQPKPDLTWSEVPEDLLSEFEDAIQLEVIAAGGDLESGATLIASGIPLSKARLRNGQKVLHAAVMSASGDLIVAQEYSRVSNSPKMSYGIHFQQSNRLTLAGKPAVASFPRGMSGGAMFLAIERTWPDGHAEQQLSLRGFLTEFHESDGILLATRYDRFLDGLVVGDLPWERQCRRVDA